jgi:hypothetical protein
MMLFVHLPELRLTSASDYSSWPMLVTVCGCQTGGVIG